MFFITDTDSTGTLSSEYCIDVNTTQQLMHHHYPWWSHNGSYIGVNTNDLKYNSSLLAEEPGDVKVRLSISNLSFIDIGDYTGIIYGDIYNMLSWCSEYRNYIPSWWYLIGYFPVAVVHFSINNYSRFSKLRYQFVYTIHVLL